jgi:hypothetical protein
MPIAWPRTPTNSQQAAAPDPEQPVVPLGS